MEISITELSALLNGTVEGNGSLMLNTVSKIEEGKEGACLF
jgi:UDP-3-O-[3-hydroxymyristoyl] glucosamine N-acyltransferase